MKFNRADLDKLSPERRQEAEKLLAQIQGTFDANPLLLYNHPQARKKHPRQIEYHTARTKIKALIGGNRSGKTAGGIVDDLIQAVDLEALPEHLKPFKRWGLDGQPFKGRIVAPKFNENIEQVIFPTIREWVPRQQLLGASWEKAFSKQRRVLTFENGSTIQFLTFDQDIDAHAGAALHRVHFDEEPDGDKGLSLFNENYARLTDYDGDFCLTMTPLFGLSWSYDRIWERRHDDNVTVVQVDSTQNPHINQDALAEFFASLTKEERQARKEGRFVHFAGKFYDEFTDAEHVVKGVSRDHVKDQTIVVGIDPGLNRTGVVWTAFDNDNAALVFAELYPTQAVVADVAAEIKKFNAALGIEVSQYVIDPSARNRATVNADAVEAAYAREGIYCTQGQNDRAAGILEVKRRLQQHTLVVSDACPNLIREFGRYRKDPNSADEFAAVKKDDHLLDALRYVCMERAWTLPQPTESKTYSSHPFFEPPWKGPTPTESPPLGAFS